MDVNKILSDISTLKIQGAENIAKASIRVLNTVAKKSYTTSPKQFVYEMEAIRKKLEQTRPTEPCLRNTVAFILAEMNTLALNQPKMSLQERVIARCNQALQHFTLSEQHIIDLGAKKIRTGMTVYTHCHSSTVIRIFRHAKDQGKKFRVHCTETRPRFQGRLTAQELSENKIPVTLYVDAAMKLAIKDADAVFLGADAITAQGAVINKIGSGIIAHLAYDAGIPLYICSNGWKYSAMTTFGKEEKIEIRDNKEVWPDAPKSVSIYNPAFEIIPPEKVVSIISELGIYKPEVFVQEARAAYPWIFMP